MIDLKQQVVIVTGGAGLIGRSFVTTIAENNGTAIIADIDEISGIDTMNRISEEAKSDSIDYMKVDINNKDSIISLIENVETKYGRIDALVNNAYPRNNNYGRHFFEVQYDDFCENINLHLGGYFLVSQQLAIIFKKQQFGNIINIASIYGVIPPRFEIYDDTSKTVPVEYAVVKSALLLLSKYMAKYFKGMNIRVNSISPGGIFDHQPESFLEKYKKNCNTKGMLEGRDLQGALLFLLSDMSKYINGQNIIVDDGFSL
jgi:NAD(P)-dependent dehydrogenase (short-subunit alcohol dehydrogenase family)